MAITAAEINAILAEWQTRNTRTYIGMRYVPVFKGVWDGSLEYEPLTIVQSDGSAYVSKSYVPVGVPVTDATFWMPWGDFANGVVTLETLSAEVASAYVRTFDTVADMQAATDLLAGMTCHTNGFHSAGDGGAAYYTISASGTANGMDVLALQNGLKATLVVTEPYVTPEMFGAYGSLLHDDSSAVAQMLTYTNCKCVLSKTYYLSTLLTIQDNTFIEGKGVKTGFSFTGNLAECITFTENCHFTFKDFSVTNESGIGIQIKKSGCDDSTIRNLKVDSVNYGILVNSGVTDSKNLKIVDNIVTTPSIAIEVNSTADDGIENISINGNMIEALGNSALSSAISIAHGRNIEICNNIANGIAYEGIHVEDGSENINIIGNILTECEGTGIVLYAKPERSTDVPHVTDNLISFSASADNTGKSGINVTYTTYGTFPEIDLSRNKIKGFANAFKTSQAMKKLNVDGCIIDGCDILIADRFPENIVGTPMLVNTPVIGHISESAGDARIFTIESIVMQAINLGQFLSVENATLVMRHFEYLAPAFKPSSSASTNKIPLLNAPSYMDGIITVRYASGANKTVSAHKVLYDGTTLTTQRLSMANNGVASNPVIEVSNGVLQLSIYAAGTVANNPEITFDGTLIFTSGYNVQ